MYACGFEAVGEGMAVAKESYPIAERWYKHDVMTCPETNVLDPDESVGRIPAHREKPNP